MCKWGTDKKVKVIRKDSKIKVDKCLAPLVKMLNKYGIETIACCCGHGKSPTSGIRISANNIELVQLDDDLTVHLEFPYQGKK